MPPFLISFPPTHALSAGGGLPLHDPLHPEVRTLRERLEEEQMALAARERDKTALEGRIARLTHCILHGSAAATQVRGLLVCAGF